MHVEGFNPDGPRPRAKLLIVPALRAAAGEAPEGTGPCG